VTALRRYVDGSDDDDLARWNGLLDVVVARLDGLSGVAVKRHVTAQRPVPQLRIEIDESVLGFTAYDVVNRLLAGEPAIAVGESHAEFGRLSVNAQGLTEEEAEVVGRRLREVLSRGIDGIAIAGAVLKARA